MTLDEYANKILRPATKKMMAEILAIPVEEITDDLLDKYVQSLLTEDEY